MPCSDQQRKIEQQHSTEIGWRAAVVKVFGPDPGGFLLCLLQSQSLILAKKS
jgi:hypothetical protein